MSNDASPKNMIFAKVAGGLFAAVIAPIAAGLGVNFFQKKIDDPPPNTAVEKPAAGTPAQPSLAPESAPAPPAPPITLFNGKDLTGFHTYLGPKTEKGQPLGVDTDPDKVFSVTEKGWIRISGQTHGALETTEEYENYHLSLEYKWGEKFWGNRGLREARENEWHAGVAVHCSGPEGANHQAWKAGYRIRMTNDQGVGDIVLYTSPTKRLSLAVEAMSYEVVKKSKEHKKASTHARFFFEPGGEVTTVTGEWSTVHRFGAPRVPGPSTNPDTNWHTLECECAGDTLTISCDGKSVLKASKLSQAKGSIQLVSDNSEIFFRNLTLRPLPAEKH